jgi:hypothetical protein
LAPVDLLLLLAQLVVLAQWATLGLRHPHQQGARQCRLLAVAEQALLLQLLLLLQQQQEELVLTQEQLLVLLLRQGWAHPTLLLGRQQQRLPRSGHACRPRSGYACQQQVRPQQQVLLQVVVPQLRPLLLWEQVGLLLALLQLLGQHQHQPALPLQPLQPA